MNQYQSRLICAHHITAQSHTRLVQNIIVAATLPSYGLKSVEMSIGSKFPAVRYQPKILPLSAIQQPLIRPLNPIHRLIHLSLQAIRITNDHLHKHHPRIEQTFVKVPSFPLNLTVSYTASFIDVHILFF